MSLLKIRKLCSHLPLGAVEPPEWSIWASLLWIAHHDAELADKVNILMDEGEDTDRGASNHLAAFYLSMPDYESHLRDIAHLAEQGKIASSGIEYTSGRRQDIINTEWPDLKPSERVGLTLWPKRRPSKEPSYTGVTFDRSAVIAHWPPPPAARPKHCKLTDRMRTWIQQNVPAVLGADDARAYFNDRADQHGFPTVGRSEFREYWQSIHPKLRGRPKPPQFINPIRRKISGD